MSNAYFAALARSMETVAEGQRNNSYPHNSIEVVASAVQAIAQSLAGGDPSSTVMPPDVPPVLTDPVQISGVNNEIPFVPLSFLSAAVQSVSVLAPITETGTAANPIIGLTTPLPVVDGGTGTATPSLVAGVGIAISNSWPDQTISASGGVAITSAVQASVPADGSAAANVTYAAPFPTSTTAVAPGIINDYQANAWNLTVQVTNLTASGFTVNVAGGPPGSTVSVGYIASGT